jgi:hypothetical protein
MPPLPEVTVLPFFSKQALLLFKIRGIITAMTDDNSWPIWWILLWTKIGETTTAIMDIIADLSRHDK